LRGAGEMCGDMFCTGCEEETKKQNEALEAEVNELTERLHRAEADLHEMRRRLEHQNELLYLYRTANTARRALDMADYVLERGWENKRRRE
jgi:molecular chaperone GrpE (heat shock protein)